MKKTLENLTKFALRELDDENYESNLFTLEIGLVPFSKILAEFVDGLETSIQLENYGNLESPFVDKLFCSYIYGELKNEYIVSTGETEKEFYLNFLKTLSYLINKTFNKYSVIIKYYEDERESLLNKLESINETMVNDTPQTTENATTSEYMSQYTKIKTTSDTMTLMSKLNEINKGYEDIYNQWKNEFKGVFYYE